MKRSLFIAITSIPGCFFAVAIYSGTNKYMGSVEKQKESDRARVENARKKITEIKKEIAARNLKFRVDLTEALKYEISEITGAEVPDNISDTAGSVLKSFLL